MFLNRLKDIPKDKNVIIITIIGFVIVLLIYVLIFAPIEAGVPTYGILDYEFAWTPDNVQVILLTWGVEGIFKQFLAICWDFLYIVGYVTSSLGLIILILRRAEGKIQFIGLYFIIIPFLTGILDIIENANLLIMFRTPTSVSAINSFMASICALLKFSFLFTGISYVIVALITIFIKKIKKNHVSSRKGVYQ